jgi:uncharacterized protein (DUF488 family)
MIERVYSIGHSTHPAEAFIRLLERHAVAQLADIRTMPRSRRHPQFGREALAATLGDAGIAYRHLPALGGLRRPAPDSSNTAWQHPSFRGYADYMGTDAFKAGLDGLLGWAAAAPTAIMCAEALWWRCHRRLIADALVARSIPIVHILASGALAPHELTPFARISGREVTYPGLLTAADPSTF